MPSTLPTAGHAMSNVRGSTSVSVSVVAMKPPSVR